MIGSKRQMIVFSFPNLLIRLTNISAPDSLEQVMAKKTLLSGVILFFCVALAPGQEKKPSPPISLAPWILHAKLMNEVLPEYPASALENRVQGDVFVDIVVDENGRVQTAKAVDCMNCSLILGDAAV